MASLATRALLVVVCGFAALSSSAAAALGLAEERIFVFTALVMALSLLPFLVRPRLVRPGGPILLLWLMLAAMVLVDLAGEFDPLDARAALPLLVLLAAPNLARSLAPGELGRFVWRSCRSMSRRPASTSWWPSRQRWRMATMASCATTPPGRWSCTAASA